MLKKAKVSPAVIFSVDLIEAEPDAFYAVNCNIFTKLSLCLLKAESSEIFVVAACCMYLESKFV